MDLKPPPGSRMVEYGDRMIVRVGPNATGAELAWNGVWLAVWTVAGIAWLLHGGGGLLFLGAWACVELAALASLGWYLFGTVWLYVTPHELEVRKELGRFRRTKRYDPALAAELRRQLTADLDPIEAQAVGAALARPSPSAAARRYAPARDDSVGRPFALVAVVALGAAAVLGASTVLKRVEAPESPFAQRQGDARVYAESRTSSSLIGRQLLVTDRPTCGSRVTWERWTCLATVRAVTGPDAGQTLVYRCAARGARVDCRPDG